MLLIFFNQKTLPSNPIPGQTNIQMNINIDKWKHPLLKICRNMNNVNEDGTRRMFVQFSTIVILPRISDNLNCVLRMKEHYGPAGTYFPQ